MKQCTSLTDAITAVTSTYGAEILKDGNRFCAILGDIAPSLEKERKIIRRAKDEEVFPLIWEAFSADTAKRAHIISKIEYTLKTEAGFSDEWYQILMTGFSEAFAWTIPTPQNTTAAPVATIPTTPTAKKKYFTKNIARNTFSTSPKQIVLPEKYNAVGEHAFDYIGLSVHVDSVTIPNGYVEIQRYAFHPLKIDHFISIPDSVVEIADNAFTLEKYAYVLCSPNSYAYQYCTKHYLSNSVDGIPEKSEHIRITRADASNIDSSTASVEYLATGLRDLIIPKGTTSVEKGAFRNRNDFEMILSDNNLKFIKTEAFKECESLRFVVLGSALLGIASNAFSGCTNLEIVFLNLTDADTQSEHFSISKSAFSSCPKLQAIISDDYCVYLEKYCHELGIAYTYWHGDVMNNDLTNEQYWNVLGMLSEWAHVDLLPWE